MLYAIPNNNHFNRNISACSQYLASEVRICYDSLISNLQLYTIYQGVQSVVILTMIKHFFFILLGIGGISALVFIHELGHYLFCKLFSIKTPSFSIGFGPRLYTKRMWDTDFVISAILLGGYVEIAGLAEVGQGEQKDAHTTDSTSFSEKPYYQKALTLLGGIFFNILFAYAVFIGIHFTGTPAIPLLYVESGTTKVAQIQEESPAAQSKLRPGDIILSINDTSLNGSIASVSDLIKTSTSDIKLEVERDDQTYTTEISLVPSNTCSPHLGIVFAQEEKAPLSLAQSIKAGITSTHRWIKRVALSYMQLFKKCDTSSMGGPIKIISMMTQGAADGVVVFLLFLAIISINLAVFNLIPVPILDGGQLLIQTIESLIGRNIPLKVREYIFMGTWIVFLLLTAYLSFYDIKGLISPYIDTIKGWFQQA